MGVCASVDKNHMFTMNIQLTYRCAQYGAQDRLHSIQMQDMSTYLCTSQEGILKFDISIHVYSNVWKAKGGVEMNEEVG